MSGRVEIGRVIERYVVEANIGEGGMATVYLLRHRHLGTPAALKVLGSVGPGAEVRLMLEGRVQAALRHPNVVAVTDVLDVDGAPGLLMEYVEPPSLAAWLAQHQPTVAEAEALFRGIVDGVRHAHRYGLVHRDLKPSNVLLAQYDGGLIPKVADFGLAKILSDDPAAGQTRSGLTMGTPQYMAPEQFRDAKKVDRRADIFSLGCILYELLAGAPPFAWTDFIQLYQQIMNREYAPLPAEVPLRLREAVEACLEPERDARCIDCDSLLALLDGRGRLANPTVSPESLPRLVEMPMLRDRLTGATGSLVAEARPPGGQTVVSPIAEPETVVSRGVSPPNSTKADPASLESLAEIPSVVAPPKRAPVAPTMVPESSPPQSAPEILVESPKQKFPWFWVVGGVMLIAGGTFWALRTLEPSGLANEMPDGLPTGLAVVPEGAASPSGNLEIAKDGTTETQSGTGGALDAGNGVSGTTEMSQTNGASGATGANGGAGASGTTKPTIPAGTKPGVTNTKPPRPVVEAQSPPETTPVSEIKPAVAAPEPAVELAVAAPLPANVRIEGDASKVVAVFEGKRFPLPGTLAPGKYDLLAWFPDISSAKVGTLTVTAGQSLTLQCTAAFVQCNPR